MVRLRICECGNHYNPDTKKRGLITQCDDCSPEEVLVGGNMVWEHKTAPTLVIRPDIMEARKWARMEARANGQSPMRSLIQAKETRESSELDGKRGSGAEFHAQYYSRLGEKRSVHDRRTQ